MEKYGCRFYWQFSSLKINSVINIVLMCFQNGRTPLNFSFNCKKIPHFLGKVLFFPRFQAGLFHMNGTELLVSIDHGKS